MDERSNDHSTTSDGKPVMDNDWVPLRDHLRESMAEQLDDKILHDPDPEARAMLAANRDRVLALLTDQAELVVLRQAVAERGPPLPRMVRINGQHSRRLVKV
jgi:hypothetical protein